MEEIEALRKELADTRLAYQMAVELCKFKTGFLGKISHELRSPLSSLMGLHQLILSNLCENPTEEREFIVEAYNSAQKLMRILDEIVIISKIESGKISLEYQVLCLTKILDKLEQSTHLQAKNKTLILKIIPPSSEIYLMADERRLLQAITTIVETGISLLDKGTIEILTQVNGSNDLVQLIIDIPCSLDFGEQEQPLLDLDQLTLESCRSLSQNLDLSSELKLHFCQTLLESMGGQINLINFCPKNQAQEITRVLVLIPLASAQNIPHLETKD